MTGLSAGLDAIDDPDRKKGSRLERNQQKQGKGMAALKKYLKMRSSLGAASSSVTRGPPRKTIDIPRQTRTIFADELRRLAMSDHAPHVEVVMTGGGGQQRSLTARIAGDCGDNVNEPGTKKSQEMLLSTQ